jgi:hypothetical protein
VNAGAGFFLRVNKLKYTSFNDSPFLKSLHQRADLDEYGNLSHVFYALEIFAGIEDIHIVAPEVITEGGEDENIDVLYVDREQGRIFAIQSYRSVKIRERAELSKAQESSYAIDALFSAKIEKIPLRIRTQIEEARDAISKGDIKTIHIWFVHNCPEHEDSERVMNNIASSATNQLRYNFPNANINVDAKEVGLETLDDIYKSQQDAILISENIKFGDLQGFVERGPGWMAFVTSIPGYRLAELLFSFGEEKLFSANVRSYLGSNYKDKVINGQIVDGARKNPNEFFICNNGVTALVHDFHINPLGGFENLAELVSIDGISIVNGAQTTGCLSEVGGGLDKKLKVNIRFIKVSDGDQVKRVTKATNSQNKILPSDFRSGDKIQTRLRDDFDKVDGALYMGGLRKNLSPAEKRELLPTETVAQVLMAFHGHPTSSYHDKSKIWESSELYGTAFSNTVTAAHILFVYSLHEAINEKKKEFTSKLKNNELLPQDETVYHLLKMPGVTFLIIHAISNIIESVLGRPIADKYAVAFDDRVTRQKAVKLWSPLVARVIRRTSRLEPAARNRLSRRGVIDDAMIQFVEDMDMNREEFPEWFSGFIKHVI